MKAFVTGGTGFIGGHLIKRLLDDGFEVKALARNAEKAKALSAQGVEIVMGDMKERESFHGALSGCGVLFHLGNVASWWLPDKSDFIKINVEGTRNIMEEALEAGVKKIVFTSSLAAIRQPKGQMSTEDLEHRGDFESRYARSKYLAEKEILKLYRDSILPVVILNPGVVIGPGDLKTFGRMLIEYVERKLKFIPFPDTFVPLVYIDDVIEAHVMAFQHGRNGERYIIVGDNITIAGAFKVIEEITGVLPPRKTISPLMLKFIAWFMELKANITGVKPKLARDAVRAMDVGAMGSNEKSKRELSLAYTPLKAALEKTLEWYRAEGYLE